MELGFQGLEEHRGGSWVREGMDGRERARARMQGRGYLVFLQGRCDLAEIRAQGRILHQLSMLPQPGFLLLTAVQELCLLQRLLQRGPPEGWQGLLHFFLLIHILIFSSLQGKVSAKVDP